MLIELEVYDKLYYDTFNKFDFFNSLSPKSKSLLVSLERYVNGAIIEWYRIDSEKRQLINEIYRRLEEAGKIEKGVLEDKIDPYVFKIIDKFSLDIHFYFICCEKVQNLIKILSESENNQELKDLWNSLNLSFKPYNDARNHLEHIDERTTPRYINDLGNIQGDIFTFGGERYDISKKSLDFICQSYEKVLKIVKTEKP